MRPPDAPAPEYGALVEELRKVRRAGLVQLRELELPALRSAADAWVPKGSIPGPQSGVVERLLQAATAELGGGTLQDAAGYTLGLAQGTRDWAAADRRRRAAQVYGVSPERFRKHHEPMVLGQLAEQIILLLASVDVVSSRSGPSPSGGMPGHRVLRVPVGGRVVPVTVHVHSVDLLRDVDAVVVPANTYFALPAPYKSSFGAALRRAGAYRDPMGGLLKDAIQEELSDWIARHGGPGRPAEPGTVAVTTAGALAHQGIRRMYHVAVAIPRPGTNEYEAHPADVTRGVARVFALLAEDSVRHDPPLRSVCLSLLGAGRGGLDPVLSAAAVWAAAEAELVRGARWDLHFAVRRPDRADLVERVLGSLTGRTPDERR